MNYSLVLSLHIVGFVSWFAGLFYLVRLLIYHSEALEQDQPGKEYLTKQFIIMTRRLHSYITLPAALFTIFMGFNLMIIIDAYQFFWFKIKLFLVLILTGYHIGLYFFIIKFRYLFQQKPLSSKFLRFYNELATVLLVAIVFFSVMKDYKQAMFAWLWFLVVLAGLMALFLLKKKFFI